MSEALIHASAVSSFIFVLHGNFAYIFFAFEMKRNGIWRTYKRRGKNIKIFIMLCKVFLQGSTVKKAVVVEDL